MSLKVVVDPAEDGGYWALPGCASQGETMDELLANIREAIEALEVSIDAPSGAEIIGLAIQF